MSESLEGKLFTWEDWDAHDVMSFSFGKCVLKQDVGDFPAGTNVDYIGMDYDTSVMTFYGEDDKELARFALALTVGDKLPPSE